MNRLGVPISEAIDFAFYPNVPEVSLELTPVCNLKCPYCANSTLTRPKIGINWELLENIVEECAREKFNLAWLHGVGEPLLWDRLEDAIRLIRLIKLKNAGQGSFGTNGTILDAKRVRKLLDAGLDSIYVSIDTLDPGIYKSTRGGKLSIVIDNIKEMIRIVPKSFLIKIALMDHKDHRLTENTMALFHQTFGHHENVVSNLVQNALFPSAPGDYRISTEKTSSCLAPRNYLFIAADGRAAICCLDQDILHSLGNVNEKTIREIWFNKANQTLFRNLAGGIYSCPEVCTEKCVMNKPALPPQNALISLGMGLPFQEAQKFAEILIVSNEPAAAMPIVQELLGRDPANDAVQGMHNYLKTLGSR